MAQVTVAPMETVTVMNMKSLMSIVVVGTAGGGCGGACGGLHVISRRGPGLACRPVSNGDEETVLRLAAYIQKHARNE